MGEDPRDAESRAKRLDGEVEVPLPPPEREQEEAKSS